MYKDENHFVETTKVQPYVDTSSYDIFLDESVSSPEYYRSVITTLNKANEGDKVNIFINSGGGLVSTATAIIHAMDRCSAKIVAHLVGDCCSAATMIALHADMWEISENVTFMVHTCSFGVFNSAEKIKDHHDFIQNKNKETIFREYLGFLTEEECEEVLKGKEYWFDKEETSRRWTSFVEFHEEKESSKLESIREAQLEEEDLYVEAVLSVAKNKGLLSEEEVKLSRKIEDVLEKVIEECKEEVEDLLQNPEPVSEDSQEENVLEKITFPAKEIPCVKVTDEKGNVTAIISYEEEDFNIVNIELEEYSSGEVYNISKLEYSLQYWGKDFKSLFDVLGLAFPMGTLYSTIADTVKQTVIDIIKENNSKN